MKKLAVFFMNLMFVVSLAACGAGVETEEDAPVVTPPVSENADVPLSPSGSETADPGDSGEQAGAVVYFTADISPEGLRQVYEALDWTPTGKVAVKLSTGEPPASNYLRPELIEDLVQSVNGTIVECNTAYGGSRTETAMHMQVAEDHGFTAIADVDILDAEVRSSWRWTGEAIWKQTMSAPILRIMILTLCFRILKDMRWQDLAVQSKIFPSGLAQRRANA